MLKDIIDPSINQLLGISPFQTGSFRPRWLYPAGSVHFRVNLLIEEVLAKDLKFSLLFPHSVGPHKPELLERELIKLVFNFPDVGLLQLGYRFLSGRLFLGGLS